MLLDDVDDLAVEFVLEREIHTLFHVRHDDERTHARGERVVRVLALRHVLREVLGLHQFAHVVEERAGLAEIGVGADRLARTSEASWPTPMLWK